MKNTLIIAILLMSIHATAQVGIGTLSPNSSAALEIKDTARGLLIPRMTMAQRKAIINPAEALMVYQTDSTKGFWYWESGIWKNINAGSVANNGGKNTIFLTGNITDQEAIDKIARDFGSNTQEVFIYNCSNLTTVDLSMCTSLQTINIKYNSVLKSIDLHNLNICYGLFIIKGCLLLNSVKLNSLKSLDDPIYPTYYGGSGISLTGIINLNFPNLIKLGHFEISVNNSLTEVSFPSLVNIGGLYFSHDDSIKSLFFPVLTTFDDGGIVIRSCKNLESISLDNLAFSNNKVLYEFNRYDSSQGYLSMNANKLSPTNVNYLLKKLVSITPFLTRANIDLSGNNPAAPPTGQGLIDKATLIARGNTVYTD